MLEHGADEMGAVRARSEKDCPAAALMVSAERPHSCGTDGAAESDRRHDGNGKRDQRDGPRHDQRRHDDVRDEEQNTHHEHRSGHVGDVVETADRERPVELDDAAAQQLGDHGDAADPEQAARIDLAELELVPQQECAGERERPCSRVDHRERDRPHEMGPTVGAGPRHRGGPVQRTRSRVIAGPSGNGRGLHLAPRCESADREKSRSMLVGDAGRDRSRANRQNCGTAGAAGGRGSGRYPLERSE